jgi:hypothetical protein
MAVTQNGDLAGVAHRPARYAALECATRSDGGITELSASVLEPPHERGSGGAPIAPGCV